MKNFLRALKFSWAYRTRLVLSLLFALAAAGFWGAGISAVQPVMHLITEKETLQEWVNRTIREEQKKVNELTGQLNGPGGYRNRLEAIQGLRVETRRSRPDTEAGRREKAETLKFCDREEASLVGKVSDLEGKLDWAGFRLYGYHLLKQRVVRFLPEDRFHALATLLGLVLLCILIKGVCEFAHESLVGGVVQSTLFDIRNRFFRNVIHQDVKQFGDNGTHQLMSSFTNDMDKLGIGVRMLFGKVVAEPLKAIVCIALACIFSWQLTLLFLIIVPLAMLVMTKVSRVLKRATRRVLEGMSRIYKILQETFSGIRVVKSFTMEPYERRRFREATADQYRKSMKVVYLDALAGPVVELLGMAAILLTLLAGSYLVIRGTTHLFGLKMTNGLLAGAALVQLYTYLFAIADPVRKLSRVYTKLQTGAAAADRVFTYMDQRPAVDRNLTGDPLPRHARQIEFRHVCFSYEPGRDILTNVNLTIRAGETVAVVGKNGSGKTTLLGLVPRLYDPDHGSVLIDGHDLRRVNLRTLRRQVGVVTQETFLFDDTVYNNIAYGNPLATREEVEAAAKKAFVHETIVGKLPAGYATPLGEAGRHLSGGERQKIALARAILRDPSVLILDEFTSQYDTESEQQIHQALREFMKGRTTFVITHRLHTLQVADRIVVLDGGRVAAVGTHAELLAACPAYQRLHEAAFSERLSA